MELRRLGNSGLLVSELCLGTMLFDEGTSRATPPLVAQRMVDQYLDAGGNFVDTANVYGGGHSEETVGQALKGRRQRVILTTKVCLPRGEGANDAGLSRRHIMQQVECSLRRLQTDHVDLYYAHICDPVTPVEESMRAFDDLVTAGKVRYLGVSNFKAWQVMKALGVSDANGWARFVAAQYQHSLVVRDVEREFTDLFRSEGLGEVPWGALGGGFLSGKYKPGDSPSEGRLATTPDEAEESWSHRNTERNWRVVEAVSGIAASRGRTPCQIALNWLLAKPEVCSVLVGPRTPEQLSDNLGAAGWSLDDEELDQLDIVSAPELGYPYQMIKEYARR